MQLTIRATIWGGSASLTADTQYIKTKDYKRLLEFVKSSVERELQAIEAVKDEPNQHLSETYTNVEL